MTENVGVAVANAVASELDVDPIDLRPLGEIIDADALDNLFRDGVTTGSVEFEYEGCRVKWRSSGGLDVSRLE